MKVQIIALTESALTHRSTQKGRRPSSKPRLAHTTFPKIGFCVSAELGEK